MKHSVVLIAGLLAIVGVADTARAQKPKPAKSPVCSFPDYTFTCPQGLKTVVRDVAKKVFLARRIEKDYTFGVFVIDGNATSDVVEMIEKELLPKFVPTLGKELKSRAAESMSTDRMSDFEVDRKLRFVFDGRLLVGYVYREFKQGDRRFYAGSAWLEKRTASDAADTFREVTIATEGGCDNILPIVRMITKEKRMKDSDDKHPCRVEIFTTPSTVK
jgi:hypothetical protein